MKAAPICPLLKKPCIEDGCKFWTRLIGTHPQTGNPVDHYDCAVTWIPVMLVETAKEVRQSAAATESFRNEAVQRQDRLNLLLAAAAEVGLDHASPQHRLPPR